MNNKIVAILIIVAAISFGGYIFMQSRSGVMSQAEVESLRGDAEFYKFVAKCEEDKATKKCCLQSLKEIKDGGYRLSEDETCTEYEEINTLKCIGSYKWCEK